MVRHVLCACGIAACAMGLSLEARADTIEYAGRSYVTIDWQTSSTATDIATGTVLGRPVTYHGAHVQGNKIFTDSYLGDDGFDELTFGTGMIDNIKIGGGVRGYSTIDFGMNTRSVLLLIGIPSNQNKDNWGPSFWDFQDDVMIESVDSRQVPGITAFPHKLVDNIGPGHITGVVRITGDFSTLTWYQDSPLGGLDKMRITFAIEVVPAPGAIALLGIAAGLSKRRRRST